MKCLFSAVELQMGPWLAEDSGQPSPAPSSNTWRWTPALQRYWQSYVLSTAASGVLFTPKSWNWQVKKIAFIIAFIEPLCKYCLMLKWYWVWIFMVLFVTEFPWGGQILGKAVHVVPNVPWTHHPALCWVKPWDRLEASILVVWSFSVPEYRCIHNVTATLCSQATPCEGIGFGFLRHC